MALVAPKRVQQVDRPVSVYAWLKYGTIPGPVNVVYDGRMISSSVTAVAALLLALTVAALALNDLAASRSPRFTLRNWTLLIVACALLGFCFLRFSELLEWMRP